MRIDGRRVVLDVERGRTVEGWIPRRLGGGTHIIFISIFLLSRFGKNTRWRRKRK